MHSATMLRCDSSEDSLCLNRNSQIDTICGESQRMFCMTSLSVQSMRQPSFLLAICEVISGNDLLMLELAIPPKALAAYTRTSSRGSEASQMSWKTPLNILSYTVRSILLPTLPRAKRASWRSRTGVFFVVAVLKSSYTNAVQAVPCVARMRLATARLTEVRLSADSCSVGRNF